MAALSSGSTIHRFAFLAAPAKRVSRGPDETHNRVLANRALEVDMLWTIFVVLLILWLLGFSLHIGGALIHILLVVGLIVLVINLLSGRRTAV
jgi:hypothetical protein